MIDQGTFRRDGAVDDPASLVTAADAGMHSFSATLKTAGSQSLTATDIANGAINGAQGNILVTAAAASGTMAAVSNVSTTVSLRPGESSVTERRCTVGVPRRR